MTPKTAEAIPRSIVVPAQPLTAVNFQGWSIPVPPAPQGPGLFVSSPYDAPSQTITSWMPINLTDRRWPGQRDPRTGALLNQRDKIFAAMSQVKSEPRRILMPNETLQLPNPQTAVWSQQYTARFQWVALLQQTTQAGAMSHDITYTTGTDITDAHTTSFELSIGMEAGGDIMGVGTKMTSTFTYGQSNTHQVTVSKSQTVTQHLEVPKNTTVQVWQLVQVFETSPSVVSFADMGFVTLALGSSLTQPTLEVISLSYPR